MSGFRMTWDPVQGAISPELVKRQGYGSIIGDAADTLSTFADARRKENTQEILMDLNRIDSTAALAERKGELNALVEDMGGAIDQAGVLDAITKRNETLKGKELEQYGKDADKLLNDMKLGGKATLDDVQAAALMADPSQAGKFVTYANDIKANEEARRLQQRKEKQEDIDYGLKVNQDARAYTELQAKLVKMKIDNPDSVTENTYTDESGTVRTYYTLNPGFEKLFNAQVGGNEGNGVDTVVSKILGAESGNEKDPNTAKNPNSSATGAGQFIKSTWIAMISKYRPELVKGKSESEILALRTDGNLSREMTRYYAQENSDKLQTSGLSPSAGNIYLAHFAGPDTAIKALKVDPNTPTSKVFKADQIKANPSILQGKTVGEVISWAHRKMGGSGVLSNAASGGSANGTNTVNNPFGSSTGNGGPIEEAVTKGGITVPTKVLAASRNALAAIEQSANTADAIKRGTADYTQADFAYKDYIRSSEVDDSKGYRVLNTNKVYNRLTPDVRLQLLKDVVKWEKENTPMFSVGPNAKDLNAFINSRIVAAEKARTAGQRSAILTEYVKQGNVILAEAKRKNPKATIDDALKALNPTLYKEYKDAIKKSQATM